MCVSMYVHVHACKSKIRREKETKRVSEYMIESAHVCAIVCTYVKVSMYASVCVRKCVFL